MGRSDTEKKFGFLIRKEVYLLLSEISNFLHVERRHFERNLQNLNNKTGSVSKYNIEGRSRYSCCDGNTTMHSVCVVELRVAVSYINMLSVA